jgi:hypothetical protein
MVSPAEHPHHTMKGILQPVDTMQKEKHIKNAVFWVVTPCCSCKNRRFGGIYRLHHQGGKIQRAKNNVSRN